MESGLPLRLSADEDVQSRILVQFLRDAGHDALTVNDAGLQGEADEAVLDRAIVDGRTLLTRNPADFLELHTANPDHPGILAVYQDNDPSKNMSRRDLVRAIANIEASETPIRGPFLALNSYSW